jgi:hypothetical protein
MAGCVECQFFQLYDQSMELLEESSFEGAMIMRNKIDVFTEFLEYSALSLKEVRK